MTAAWVLDCHYNITHELSSPQTTSFGWGLLLLTSTSTTDYFSFMLWINYIVLSMLFIYLSIEIALTTIIICHLLQPYLFSLHSIHPKHKQFYFLILHERLPLLRDHHSQLLLPLSPSFHHTLPEHA